MASSAFSTAMLPMAHLGHWYFFPLYAIPVAIVLWSALATTLRQRRERREEEERGGPGKG